MQHQPVDSGDQPPASREVGDPLLHGDYPETRLGEPPLYSGQFPFDLLATRLQLCPRRFPPPFVHAGLQTRSHFETRLRAYRHADGRTPAVTAGVLGLPRVKPSQSKRAAGSSGPDLVETLETARADALL